MNRKPNKQSRGANAQEKAFHGWLKHRSCCCCGNEPVHVHHCVGSSYKHNRVLIGHWFCIPLCDECHKLRHDHKKSFIFLYGPECDLWDGEAVHLYSIADVPGDVYNAIMDTRL